MELYTRAQRKLPFHLSFFDNCQEYNLPKTILTHPGLTTYLSPSDVHTNSYPHRGTMGWGGGVYFMGGGAAGEL